VLVGPLGQQVRESWRLGQQVRVQELELEWLEQVLELQQRAQGQAWQGPLAASPWQGLLGGLRWLRCRFRWDSA